MLGMKAGTVRVVALPLLLMACHGQPTEPSIQNVPGVAGPTGAPSAARAKVDTDSRANLVWADSILVNASFVPAGIRGDGRLKTGAASTGTPSNEYQGAVCGVQATLWTGSGESGDLNFKPDGEYSSTMQPTCGAARAYNFFLGGPSAPPTASNPHSI